MEYNELYLCYKNALSTAEFYKAQMEEIKEKSTLGGNAGAKIDWISHKISWPYRKYKNYCICKEAMSLNEEGLNRLEKRGKRIIVSLTSYPARIDAVSMTIASLLNQTVKPDKIILWLGKEKFPNKMLPPIFKKLREIGVDIEFRPDLKSHTKYFYAIQEYPEELIITVDDDHIYRATLIEELYNSYRKYPQYVSALRVHKMRFNDDGTIMKYNNWHQNYVGEIGNLSHQYFATGVGGVLYPPESLHEEVLNLHNMQKYCHNHDDLWLKVMEVMNGTKVVIAADSRITNFGIMGTQDTGQWRENVMSGGNDRQTEAVFDIYNDWNGIGNELTDIMAFDK